jgi:hypothetical protein
LAVVSSQKSEVRVRMAVPDIISPSYFTAEAAVVLGCFEQGIHAEVELFSPVEKTYAALRDGEIEIVAGSAHSALSAFPRWQGVKLLCVQSQGMYWFLVMRADIGASRGDVSCVKGRKIGAAPWAPLTLVTAIPRARESGGNPAARRSTCATGWRRLRGASAAAGTMARPPSDFFFA